MTNKLRPLIDGDILIYRCGFAADSQAKKELLGGFKGYGKEALEALAPLDYEDWALANVKSTMRELTTRAFNYPTFNLYLTGQFNFRDQLATLQPYKGQRDPYSKPKYYNEIRQYLIDQWDAEVIDGMEADDALGIEQWANKDRSTCIVGIDKDLDMIPGHHYNWVKKQWYYQTLPEANLFFFRQMLEGDRVDNIPGIDGVGPKTVDKILDSCNRDLLSFRNEVVGRYKEQYGSNWLEAYTEVGALLWIFREPGKGCPFLSPS